MKIKTLFGEMIRWYVLKAKHPLKDRILGHYWSAFENLSLWVKYDEKMQIRLSLREYIDRKIFSDRVYEKCVIDYLRQNLRHDDVFWDVGAYIGAMTLAAAGRCKKVYSFEPNSSTLKRLALNVKANRLKNVTLINSALGSRTGTAKLYQSSASNSGMSTIVSSRSNTVGVSEVSMIRGEDLLNDGFAEKPTAIKIDVEGAEDDVVAGIENFLGPEVRFIIFESKEGRDQLPESQSLTQRLIGKGYLIRPLGKSDLLINDEVTNYLAYRRDTP